MTKLAINKASFVAAPVQPEHGYWTEGTVEVTLHGETKRVRATSGLMERNTGEITAYDLVAKYVTGAKLWPARLTTVIDPRNNQPWERLSFGFNSNSGIHHKAGGVWFRDNAPASAISKR